MINSNDDTQATSPGRNSVRTLSERAQEAGISICTLRRRIKAGEGPVITRLSERRLGIREDHWRAWLDACSEQVGTD